MKPFLLCLIMIAGCAPEPNRSEVGRYRVVATQTEGSGHLLIKIDSVTGKSWRYDERIIRTSKEVFSMPEWVEVPVAEPVLLSQTEITSLLSNQSRTIPGTK